VAQVNLTGKENDNAAVDNNTNNMGQTSNAGQTSNVGQTNANANVQNNNQASV
jgi:hypothetical protein